MSAAATRPTRRPLLVLVSGVPGSGKTTLARLLGDTLHLPVLSRDDLKTGMLVTDEPADPGDPDGDVSGGGVEVGRFGEEAFDVFFDVVEHLLMRGVSLVAEAAFHRDRDEQLVELQDLADVAHLAMRLDDDLALARYEQRARQGARHPGHADLLMLEGLRARTDVYRLDEPEPRLLVDATDGYRPDLAAIVSFVEACRRS